MSALRFVAPTPDRQQYIAANLRAADRRELAITSPGESPAEVIARSVASARWAIAVEVHGRPAIVYGVSPADHDPLLGVPWMLATDDIRAIRREFVQMCAREVRLMRQHFVALYNRVHADNEIAIRWLEWLGFTIDRDRPVGPGGALYEFWIGEVRRV